jgi:hypothetical protein
VTLAFHGCPGCEGFPVALGRISSGSSGAGLGFASPMSVLEFAIAPLGLVLPGHAEVRIPYEGTSEPVVEGYDEGAGRWEAVGNVQVQDRMAVFSIQSLGRFRLCAETADEASSADGSSSGGGCFISTCAW